MVKSQKAKTDDDSKRKVPNNQIGKPKAQTSKTNG